MTSKSKDASIQLPLPVGTQVVTRIDYHTSSGEIACLTGTVGSIIHTPETPGGEYLVRLAEPRE